MLIEPSKVEGLGESRANHEKPPTDNQRPWAENGFDSERRSHRNALLTLSTAGETPCGVPDESMLWTDLSKQISGICNLF